MIGYAHPAYATSLGEFGTPRYLPKSETWILVRRIPGSPYYDGRGLYPLTLCKDWYLLREDMTSLSDLVSLVFVTDPFGDYTTNDLSFLDLCKPYKTHYTLDTELDITPSPHNSRAAKRARGKLDSVTIHPYPHLLLDEWADLYSNLVDHHDITGIARFSRASFAVQLKVPGCAAWVARFENQIVSILLWYVHEHVAYYHLGASSDKGYKIGASHALFESAIRSLRSRVRFISLGGGSGLSNQEDGLTRFKRGWAPLTRVSHLCGKVLRPDVYESLSKNTEGSFFPLYRTPQEVQK